MLAKREFLNVSNSLKKRFLFRDDVSSATILIDLYSTEENLKDIKLNYISRSELRGFLTECLKDHKGRYLAAGNLTKMIHSDINRMELLICIEGQRAGFSSRKHANTVEEILLSHNNLHDIYKNKDCFNNILDIDDIEEFRKGLFEYIENQVVYTSFVPEFVHKYMTIKIKPKVYALNKYIDKQIIVDEGKTGRSRLRYESDPFTRKELNNLINDIYNMLLTRSTDIFVESYWHGIEEKIKNRYR